jgi:hypothetical protein
LTDTVEKVPNCPAPIVKGRQGIVAGLVIGYVNQTSGRRGTDGFSGMALRHSMMHFGKFAQGMTSNKRQSTGKWTLYSIA